VDDRGQVIHYEGKHLTPASALQGDVPPGPKLFEQCLDDGRDLVGLVLAAVDQLAQVVNSVGVLPPPQVPWPVLSTGEAYFDRRGRLSGPVGPAQSASGRGTSCSLDAAVPQVPSHQQPATEDQRQPQPGSDADCPVAPVEACRDGRTGVGR
jgi:hypothetical protein